MSRKKTDVENDQINSVQKRRAALKSILLSGGVVSGAGALPTAWTRPVIDSVVLPLHAATTVDETDSGSDSQMEEKPVTYFFMEYPKVGNLDGTNKGKALFAERVLDTVIPTANAEIVYTVNPYYICLSILGNSYNGTIAAMVGQAVARYSVSGTVGVVTPLPTPLMYCGTPPIRPTTLQVHSVGPTSCQCTLAEVDGSFSTTKTVDQQDCQGFVPPDC